MTDSVLHQQQGHLPSASAETEPWAAAAVDLQHNANYIRLLAVYLHCERNASIAAKMLHVHRNTVLYHIEKIEDILEISFEEMLIRENILMALEAYELLKLMRENGQG